MTCHVSAHFTIFFVAAEFRYPNLLTSQDDVNRKEIPNRSIEAVEHLRASESVLKLGYNVSF